MVRGCHEKVSFVFAEDRLLQVRVVTDKEAQEVACRAVRGG